MIKKFFICTLFFAFCIGFSGCFNPSVPIGSGYSGGNDKIADFSTGLNSGFHTANRWSNGGMFDCQWRSENVSYNQTKKLVELTFSKEGSTNLAGEYRTNAFFCQDEGG